MSNRLQISIENHVAELVLNRPEKHNAIDMRMFDELAEAGKRVAAERSVRAVVLSGAGENFCAGIDVSIFNEPGEAINPASMAPQAGSDANRFQRAAYAGPARRSRSARTCVTRRRTRSCRSWKYAGD